MLRSPLAVRVSNNRADQHITRRLVDLDLSSTAPGGFDAASFELAHPIDVDDPLLALESRAYIYDTRTAETVWEGKLTDPGRSFSDSGQTWSLTAMGPKIHASDRFSPYIPIDRTLDAWFRSNNQWPAGTAEVGSDPGDSTDDKALVFQFPVGSLIDTGSVITMTYKQFEDAGLLLGGFGYSYDMGVNSAAYELQSTVDGTLIRNTAFTTTAGAILATSAGGGFTLGGDSISIRLNHISGGATTVGSDLVWTSVTDLWVRGLMYTKAGVQISGASTYDNPYVLASEVVADLLGQFLPQYDGAGATLTASVSQIDQLAYPDGVRPADVLDDVCLFTANPTRWLVWESNPAGLYRFEWTGWGSTPQYEASVVDGFDSPGSSTERYNRVTVTGTDARGRKQSVVVTHSIGLGYIREADPIDLGDEAYSTANAQTIGDRFLDEHEFPPNAGTLTVQQPIMDLTRGRMVDPWQIRPGGMIRVRGVNAQPDSLNAADRDGSTVFRLTGASFKDSDQSASLTLDSPASTLDNQIARLARKRTRGRR